MNEVTIKHQLLLVTNKSIIDGTRTNRMSKGSREHITESQLNHSAHEPSKKKGQDEVYRR